MASQDEMDSEQGEMESPPAKISGYRSLSDAEIDLINEIKAVEVTVAALARRIQYGLRQELGAEAMHQLSTGRTELEAGFMRLVRSVAQPVSPWSE